MRPWIAVFVVCLASCRGAPPSAPVPAPTPKSPEPELHYRELPGERLVFATREGNLRNYFLRQQAVSAHLVTRSGEEPRLIVAFPAGDQGIGVWFGAERPAEVWAGESLEEPSAVARDALRGVVLRDDASGLNGVRAVLKSDARALTAQLSLLGGVRMLRDYGYGVCLEDVDKYPELRNETIERVPGRNAVRVRREQIGGERVLELWLEGRAQTSVSIARRAIPARPGCAAEPPERDVIELTSSGERGVELEVLALSNEPPLAPVELERMFASKPPVGLEADALAFLGTQEKLLAGSWRFLTYFGRDTLLSLRLLMPVLKPEFAASAVGSVLERINLDPELRAGANRAVDLGDVAHEEEVGDFAAYHNLKDGRTDLRQPRYDYKMIDDDFLLAPVLADLYERGAGVTVESLLSRQRGDGKTFRDAILANLALVVQRARPFAADRSVRRLVGLRPGSLVGQWRDSEMGIAFGRYPFDVNAALVPGALAGAAEVYRRWGMTAESEEAERLLTAWQGVETLFRISIPIGVAKANVASYARALGVTDTSGELEAESGGWYRYYGIAVDGAGRSLPVEHSDHGFVMEFARPSDEYLVRVATALARRFPAGLMSDVGLLVANPALAPQNVRSLFTRSHYHGTVVWSWQQALLASGLRRQLARTDIGPEARAALEACECALWRAIRATASQRAQELWSWEADAQGAMQLRPFGEVRADVDESNAIQLWSTVYLAVTEPERVRTGRCEAR